MFGRRLKGQVEKVDSLLECLYALLTSPKQAMRAIMQQRSLLQAAAVVSLATVLSTMGGIAAPFFAAEAQWIIALVYVAGELFLWGLMAAVCHLLAVLLGGEGDVRQFMKVLGFVAFLDVLLAPLYFLAAVTDSAALFAGASLGIALWKYVLYVLAVQVAYNVSASKAVLILLLPFLALALLLAGIIVLAIAAGASGPFDGVLPGDWRPAQL